MARQFPRLTLQSKLEAIPGVKKVYYQPPESTKLTYPCIIYSLGNEKVKYANNILYKGKISYTVTIIDKDPDSPIPEEIRKLDYCSFDRGYASDNLNHFVFTIFI